MLSIGIPELKVNLMFTDIELMFFLQLGCKLFKQYQLICSLTLGDPWYLQDHDANDTDILGILQTTAAYVVLFNYIIPISLYVTIGK